MPEFDKTNNLRYYDFARDVPKEAQRDFNNGRFSGTDINPMWRIKMLTAMYGPAGIGWYTEIVRREAYEPTPDTVFCFIDINLYVKEDGEWSKPIFGTGGNSLKTKTSKGYIQASDEAWKMAYTDALGSACKNLGIGADVYWQSDKTKYTQEPNAEPAAPAERPASTKTKTKAAPIVPLSEFKEALEEVSQELLNSLIDSVRAPHKSDRAWETGTLVPLLKEVIGKPNYKAVPDPADRLKLYNTFYTKFVKENV